MANLSRGMLEEAKLIGDRTAAVYDNRFNKLYASVPWQAWFEGQDPLECRQEYLDTYHEYLGAMRLNRIGGLPSFSQRHLINGTTQTFDEAYHRHAKRRLRIPRGEYAYHKRAVPDYVFLDDDDIRPGDYVIISVPHCSTGDVPIGFDELLDDCHDNGVPVIVDCAYIGTCHGIEFSVDHPAIESVSFSLTKGAGLGHVRSGIRYSNLDDGFPIAQQNRFNHTVLGAAKIGIHFMKELGTPDFIPSTYRDHQLSACRDAGITPTPCMHLALGGDGWKDYNVDGYNRIGIRNLVKARKQGRI